MLVFADGRTVGTIGGGCYENDAFWKAREAIDDRQAAAGPLRAERRLRAGERAGLRRPDGRATSTRSSRPRTSTSSAPATSAGTSARLAAEAGFRIHVVDDREKFASRDRFPDAVEVVAEPIPAWLHRADLPASAYVVVVTRGHTLRPRRAARAGGAGPAVSRPDRQPRQGRAASTTAARTKACPPNASSACTRRSASTSAPSRRRRSPSASSRS